jgi:DNA replication and repair protein RecF
MHVTRLDARGLRRFAEVSLLPAPGINLITGENGAGKTSLLEALHLMAYGRSFRGRVRDGLVRSGDPAMEVFVEWQEAKRDQRRKAGLRHSGQDWTGRLDGSAEIRRRYLDWGLFHVEQDFTPLWRRYTRALKQRNALLKARARDGQLDAWDRELADSGEPLTRRRQQYLDELQPRFAALASDLAPALGEVRLDYAPGWRRDEFPLADALLLARDRDQLAGYTSVGPHRADWKIGFGAIPGRDALSRGQAKLTALSALLAQAEHHAAIRSEWPVVALDDLASELDRNHQQRVLERLLASRAQVFITGTEAPPALAGMQVELARFHVEHGVLSQQ